MWERAAMRSVDSTQLSDADEHLPRVHCATHAGLAHVSLARREVTYARARADGYLFKGALEG
jgi:hypothetical protein